MALCFIYNLNIETTALKTEMSDAPYAYQTFYVPQHDYRALENRQTLELLSKMDHTIVTLLIYHASLHQPDPTTHRLKLSP